MVVLLLALLAWNGMSYFWQKELVLVTRSDGSLLLGEIHGREEIPILDGGAEEPSHRIRMKIGNRDVGGLDFVWVDEDDIVARDRPAEATVLERLEWGNFYGVPVELRNGELVLARGEEEVLPLFRSLHPKKRDLLREIVKLEKGPIGDVNHQIEKLNLSKKAVALGELSDDARRARIAVIDEEIAARETAYRQLVQQLTVMREDLLRETLVMETADGVRKSIPVGHVVRAVQPNGMGFAETLGLYVGRVWEFLSADPRESNTEGGIFPAIFGTVMMVFIMVFAVTPLGVLAAVYLREYAKQGWMIRSIRIAVNNLAGVPSIVFGVFGLGFFVYLVGGSLDRLFFPEALPSPTFGTGGILWGSLTLALLTVPVVIVATEEGLASVPRIVREGSLALGATKFETTWKVVVPAAAPGILTGIILAMARAAGEVAPLMIVGMVKLAPSLPIDHHFPYVHLERKFMHLGFHIYDVGFQSPNVEATKPLVFATALLLVAIVVLMNLLAIWVRNRLRSKYASSAV
jgi:phosphate transport system permease protein